MKPTKTASHLKIPTFSLKRKIEKIVVNIGAAKEILTTVARGNFLNAINSRNEQYCNWGWKRPDLYSILRTILPHIRNPCMVCIMRDPIAVASRNLVSLGGDKNEAEIIDFQGIIEWDISMPDGVKSKVLFSGVISK